MDDVVEQIPSSVARWVAAMLCFLYGFAKINGSQFTVLESELSRPMGEVSGFWLTWHYFGFSPVYGAFLALVQIVSGVLLLVPRTALLGAVIMLPVVVNILLVDVLYGVDIGGTLAAVALLVCLSIVIAPFVTRLRSAVVLGTLPGRLSHRATVGVVAAVSVAFVFTWWVANVNNRVPTQIDGVWAVAVAPGNGSNDLLWDRVFFERNRAHLVVFRGTGRRDEQHHFEVDPTGVVRIWRDWLRKGPLVMQGRVLSNAEIELTFTENPTSGPLRLRRVERAP